MGRSLLYMITFGAVAAGLWFFFNRKKKQENERARERADLVGGANVTNDITRVGVGGVLKLPSFGANSLGIETYVKARHRYSDGGAPWYEVECEHEGRKLLLEWSREGAEVYVTAGYDDENPKLADLGISKAVLIEIDEAEEGSFSWDGMEWNYEDSSERTYYAKDGREGEDFYGWEFESEDESRYISIEKWDGDSKFYVYHSWVIDPEKIEIYDGGAA